MRAEHGSHKEKYTFSRVENFDAGDIEINLPDRVQEDLLTDREGSSLHKVIEEFRAAGIEQEKIDRFLAAIRAYILDRPTAVSKHQDPTSFAPQDHYFGSSIKLNEAVISSPDLLQGTEYKPRLVKDGSPLQVSEHLIDGRAVMSALAGSERSLDKITPMERLLARINRFKYAYHESLHIMQGFTIGDQLNRLKDEFGAADLVNPAKEREIVSRATREATPPFSEPEWMKTSAFVIHDHDKETWGQDVIANNEATMDILQDKALRDYILKQPALALWMHNMMSVEMQALRDYRREIEEHLLDSSKPLTPGTAYTPLRVSMEFISPLYFAAFEDSSEAEAFLQRPLPKVLDRDLAGSIVHVESFDRSEMLNLKREITMLKGFQKQADSGLLDDPKNVLDYYEFPSGKKYLKTVGTDDGPITGAGARLAARIFERAALAGLSSHDISKLFADVQKTADASGHSSTGALIQRMRDQLGINLDDNDIKEMYNVSKYLYFSYLTDGYNYNYLVRREIVSLLGKSKPEEVHNLTRQLFFEVPFMLDTPSFLEASGLGRAERGAHDTIITSVHAWEEIEHNTELGLVDLNVPLLGEENKNKLREYLERCKPSEMPSEDKREILGLIIEMAKKQRAI